MAIPRPPLGSRTACAHRSAVRGLRFETTAIVVTVLLSVAVLASAEQARVSARDQKILQIQEIIKNHDLEGASREIAIAAKRFPNDAGFMNLLGVVAAERGNFEAAELDFQQAIRQAPKLTAAYLNLGRLYVEHSETEPRLRAKALAVYEAVLRYDPRNAEANYQSAVLLLQQGKYQDSLGRLSRLPVKMQDDAPQMSVACADHAALGDRTRADRLAERLLGSPDFSEADAEQILPALQAGKRDDLTVTLLAGLQKREDLSPLALRELGLAHERLGQFPESRDTLERFVARGNLSVASLLVLARVAREEKDYQGSLGYLAHARELEPKNASVHYFFGLVCLDMNLIAEARNSFEKATSLDPDNPTYNYAMGAASAFRHDPAEAIPYFEKYLKLKPDDPRGKLALGVTLFRAKDYDGAVPWLTQAAATPQTAITADYYLGSIDVEERNLDKAHSELELALKAQPDYADALAELGQCYLLEKDFAQAEKQIQHALKVDPDHLSANFFLLNLYIRTADPRQEAQGKRYEELQKLRDQKVQEFLRMVEVRPLEAP